MANNMNLRDALNKALLTTKEYIDRNEFSKDYNDLENKPFYDTRVFENFTFDLGAIDTTGKEILYIYSSTMEIYDCYVRVQDASYIEHIIDNGTVSLGGFLTMSVTDTLYEYNDQIKEFNNCAVLLVSEDSTFEGVQLSSGVWMNIGMSSTEGTLETPTGEGELVLSYEAFDGELKTLDNVFLDEDFLNEKINEKLDTKPGLNVTGMRFIIDYIDDNHFASAPAMEGNDVFNDLENNKATDKYSHAEGTHTEATGYAAHAEGAYTRSRSYATHTEGYYTIATGSYQHVQGKYNIEDTEGNYAHIVGNGSSSARSNAHALDWNGNAWFAGNITLGAGNKEVATKEYVDNTVANITFEMITESEIDAIIADINNL